MKEIYLKEKSLASVTPLTDRFICLTNILRSILHTASISLLELTKNETSTDEIDLQGVVERFRRPADGMPIDIIDKLTPHLRAQYDKTMLSGWYEKDKTSNKSLSTLLQEWVAFRNKKPGHGVLDKESMLEWAPKTDHLIDICLKVFSSIIPKNDNGKLLIDIPSGKLDVNFPLIFQNEAIVILEVTQRQGNWKLQLQTLNFEKSETKIISLSEDNIFNSFTEYNNESHKIIEVECLGREYIVEHNIPIRQTETFEGRHKEVDHLVEWLNDDDSRRCLIYGDGGYGKTTLVLETLNRLLEGELKITKNFPTLICFYTAKMTRWTEDGLVRFSTIQPVMDECIREIIKFYNTTLDRQWYTVSGVGLIDKAVQFLGEKKISRDEILLIIDNSETLSDSPQKNAELAEFLKQAGKKIGRLIITSRRQEGIEAEHVLVEGLDDKDSVNLLKRLANLYHATPITQAGETKLRTTSNKLMNKPLLLESLVVYISRSNISIDSAVENIFRKSNEDLLEFLYEDAWDRLNDVQRTLFYIIISITSPLNSTAISRACQLVEIQHITFLESLKETHFASTLDYGSHYDLELVELAKRFFGKKLSELDEEKKKNIFDLANNVDRYTSERIRIDQEYKEDRVSEAFRSEFSKVAKVAVNNNDFKKADEYYKLAIEDDPFNSALHDRYAFFLANKVNDSEKALPLALKAIELNVQNCDALVNTALIYHRLNNISMGDEYIDKAEILGRSKSFCCLRKAMARYHFSFKDMSRDEKLLLLSEAQKWLKLAEKNYTKHIPYAAKTKLGIEKFKQFILKRTIFLRK
ncbi:tetratricopeptide repeat protein [Pantoea agglomerans]|uniref:tetratricopeptide repeat protein n=1 Tax=Enterobacter agglomerans TaxID=549 RepID=UPI0013B877D6|nr:hypothetical protein [Pantoea agglomerans]NEG58955.1 hypothetical protein [Pantoea agglomerans]NEG99542.1 hypothetical protein [Pantoea agglomerans]NEH02521.1 hypothetical protein [Pantoea agglomerans]NEH14599.1 hypothetical protein [Pantoea agglomerans]